MARVSVVGDPRHYFLFLTNNTKKCTIRIQEPVENTGNSMQNITKDETIKLLKELQEASRLYAFDPDSSTMTDEEFDAKQLYLHKIRQAKLFPELFAEGTLGNEILDGTPLLGAKLPENTDKVVYQVPMLSLQKAKEESELLKYLKKTREAGAKDFKLQAKLDGLAISALYENTHLTRISVRGNGTVGNNITKIVNNPNLTIKGLPTHVPFTNIEVRGEIFMTEKQFQKVDEARFKTEGTHFNVSRNASSGILNRAQRETTNKNIGLNYPAEMTFCVYSVVKDNNLSTSEILNNIEGFITIDTLTQKIAPTVKLTSFTDNQQIMESIKTFGKLRENFEIPTDGVVIKPTNELEMNQKLGSTEHHPNSQLAWKFKTMQLPTIVRSITNTVGRTGRITPVVHFDPIRLLDSTVSNASAHNYNILAKKGLRVGSTILVEKAHDIIPDIVATLTTPENAPKIEIPTTCPVCHTQLVGFNEQEYPPKTLECPNETCPSRDFNSLVTSVSATYLDIQWLSKETLLKLNETGKVNNIADLYFLTIKDLSETITGKNKNGDNTTLGEKTATKIYDEIQKSKQLPFERILASLCIPTIGRRISKDIVKTFPNIHTLQQATTEDFTTIKGIGEKRAKNIVDGIILRKNIINRMIQAGVNFGTNETNNNTTFVDSKHLTGKSFSITGTVPQPFNNRNDMVTYIENHGGEFHSTPKATTQIMIGDKNGNSSKTIKAIKFGLTFITPEEFTQQFVQE